MFDKTINVHLKPTDIEMLDNEMVKTASVHLPSDVKYDPDFCYFLLRAVSAGEYYDDNKNGDFFPESELKRNHTTFLKAHVFKNHENKDVKGSLGDVLRTTWLDDMKQVELFVRVDKRIAPEIVRGIEKGYITDVSMGCRVDYSICSVCGNKAKTQREYCDHIKFMRRKILEDGRKVYEININPVFHDISIVLNGAEKVAKIEGIYIHNVDSNSNNKTAKTIENEMLEKVANYHAPTPPKKIRDFGDLIMNKREVLASLSDNENLTKQEYLSKVAEIQKRIEGEIVTDSIAEILKDREEKSAKIRNVLKAFTTKYLDRSEVSAIVEKLKDIAASNKTSLYATFNEFLKVLDFAGIELSPLEFNLFHEKIMPGFKASINVNENATVDDVVKVDDSCLGCEPPKLLPCMSVISKIIGKSKYDGGIFRKVRDMSEKITVPQAPSFIQDEIMRKTVAPLIPERSMHPKMLVIRIRNMVPVSQPNNYSPYVSPTSFSDYFGKMMYSAYQNDRMERLATGETQFGMQKFSSYFEDATKKDTMFEKVAAFGKNKFMYLEPEKYKVEPSIYNTSTAISVGYPVINLLSKFERAKIANGNRVSNFGRFIADYPADAYQFQAIFGPAAYAFAKTYAVETGKGITSSAKGIFNGSYSKYAPTPEMLKRASEDCEKRNISHNNQKIFDLILNLREQKQDASATKMMKEFKISEKDLKKYLQNKKNCYKMLLNDKVKKTASEINSNEFIKLPSEFSGVVGNAALVDFIYDNIENLY